MLKLHRHKSNSSSDHHKSTTDDKFDFKFSNIQAFQVIFHSFFPSIFAYLNCLIFFIFLLPILLHYIVMIHLVT